MNIAIIFAGGTGTRMGNKEIPKQFLKVKNKEIIIYTLEVFNRNNNIDIIVCVCLEEWINYLSGLINKYSLNKVVSIVKGGINTQQSQYYGLIEAMKFSKSPKDVVLIHDGVRPLVDDDCINNNISMVKSKGSAITCIPAIETILEKNNSDKITNILDRQKCMTAKAPQSFFINDLLSAHTKAISDGKLDFIDSACMMQFYGYPLNLVLGSARNIKVTTPFDYEILKSVL